MNMFIQKTDRTASERPCYAINKRLCGTALICASLLCGAATSRASANPDPFEADPDYAAGYQFGTQLAQLMHQQPALDIEAVLKGVLDAIATARPGDAAATRPSSEIPGREGSHVDDYAALNAQRPGVVVLPSGVQYEVLKAGDGAQPRQQDIVAVNYRGYLATGIEFDSNAEEGGPASMQVDEIVVPGLREAILLMHEGDNWRVTIPAQLGFTRGRMLRKRDLIYEIELVEVKMSADNL